MKQVYETLVENMKWFNENNNNGYKFTDNPGLENVTQTYLNLIHSEFETYLTLFCGSDGLLTNEKNKNKSKKHLKPYN